MKQARAFAIASCDSSGPDCGERLESLGCWQGDAPPSLQDALRKELITPAQHKVYTELHQDMNRVRH